MKRTKNLALLILSIIVLLSTFFNVLNQYNTLKNAKRENEELKVSLEKLGKEAFKNAGPQILEPIYTITVLAPDDLTGSVIGDLQTRRAIVEGIDAEGSFAKIIAKVPLAEMHDYSSSLRSITQGRAKFKMDFADYLPVPGEIQKKLIDDYNKVAQEEFS